MARQFTDLGFNFVQCISPEFRPIIGCVTIIRDTLASFLKNHSIPIKALVLLLKINQSITLETGEGRKKLHGQDSFAN